MKKRIYLISFIIIIIDQLTKFIMLKAIGLGNSIQIIKSLFYLTILKNTGASFSILENNLLLLIIVSVVALFGLIYYIEKTSIKNKLETLSIASILGGLIGNLLDRIFRGGVIDFISIKIFSYNYPVFNIADIFIVVGVFILIFLEMRGNKNDSR